MATVIKLKRGTSTPTTEDLTTGEVGVDTLAQQFYINDSGSIKTIGVGNDATTSIKGIASFDSNDFSISSGAVSLANSSITIADNSSTTTIIGLGETLKVSGTTNEIETAISGDTITIGLPTDVTIGNNLTVTGTTTSGNLLPPTDNTGAVGTNDLTWNNGRFTDLTIDDVLTVRTAIDLADGDILRFGDNDDWELFHDGTANRIDLNTRDLTIRDNTTTRFTFGRTSGDFTATGSIALNGSITFEGSTADDFETTLGVIDPTADRAINLPNVSGTIITTGNLSSITALDATSIADGSVSNTEFQHLNGVTSAIQTQLDTKATTAFAIAQAVALG
jgi:hypothetical protein